jgi:hypothetical protein
MFFKKSSSGGAEENFGVTVGQRFRAIGTKSILWEVQSICRYAWEPFTHVRLNRVDSPGDLKTIALDVLRDDRYFTPEA